MSHSKQSNDNQEITLATYERGVLDYASRTKSEVTDEIKRYLDSILEHVPKTAAILEIGSATGRDADYIESLGYKIDRSDVVDGFIELQQKAGHAVHKFNVLTDSLPNTYDLIIASAVFLHFTEEQFVVALENVRNHLNENGMFVLSVKEGVGEEYSTHKMHAKRYFRYWQEDELREKLIANNFTVEKIALFENDKWLVAFIRK